MERAEEKVQKPQVSEADVIYAINVLDVVAEGLDRVAAQPELMPKLGLELAQKAPEILDALLAITQPNCRAVLYDLGKSAMNAVNACLQKKKPNKPR